MLAVTAGNTARSQKESSTLQIMHTMQWGISISKIALLTQLFFSPKDFSFDFDFARSENPEGGM